MINIRKLSNELRDAGITTHGNCNSSGVAWDDDNNEIQDRADVKAVIAAHDAAAYDIVLERIADRKSASKTDTKNIPNWATWDEAQAVQYITDNVTSLATAKTVLIAMTRMIVALRNQQWPDLPEG